MEFIGVDPRDVVIEDMKRTMAKFERALRSAGTIEWQPWHNARDRGLAEEFIKMANEAKESIDFAKELLV